MIAFLFFLADFKQKFKLNFLKKINTKSTIFSFKI